MTDHQQAAIEAAEKKIVQAITGFVREHKTISSEELTKEVLTAALPAIEKQLATARANIAKLHEFDGGPDQITCPECAATIAKENTI